MFLRSLAKTSVACAYSWSGAYRWRPGAADSAPFIVGYHRVVQSFGDCSRRSIPSMLISASTFEKHLDWLGGRFNFVSLDDIGEHLENGRPFSRPAAAVTFDDGYADVYHNAFPVLKRKGIPAAVFVVTDLVGTRNVLLHDRLYASLATRDSNPLATMTQTLTRFPQHEVLRQLETRRAEPSEEDKQIDECLPMSWEMIDEMSRSGISFGSHTRSHVLLTSERLEDAADQLAASKNALETRLKRRVDHFAYPDGRYNRPILNAVKAAGYRFAYTICGHRDPQFPLLTIPRKVLWENACVNAIGRFSPAVMRCQTAGVFDRQGCEHVH